MTSSQRLENSKKVSLKMLLVNKRVFMACVSSIFAMIFMLYYDTIYSDYLIASGVSKNLIGKILSFGISKNTGYFFVLGSLVYTISSPVVGWLCNKFQKMYITLFAFILASVALFLFGPSKLLGFPG